MEEKIFEFDEFSVEELKELYMIVFGHVPDWLNTSKTVKIELNSLHQPQESGEK